MCVILSLLQSHMYTIMVNNDMRMSHSNALVIKLKMYNQSFHMPGRGVNKLQSSIHISFPMPGGSE